MTSIDPMKSAKRAMLSDKKTIEAYGKLLIECGLFNLQTEVLVGALLDIAKVGERLDKQQLEVWRQAGKTFLGQLEREQSSQSRRVNRRRAEGGSGPSAANAG